MTRLDPVVAVTRPGVHMQTVRHTQSAQRGLWLCKLFTSAEPALVSKHQPPAVDHHVDTLPARLQLSFSLRGLELITFSFSSNLSEQNQAETGSDIDPEHRHRTIHL